MARYGAEEGWHSKGVSSLLKCMNCYTFQSYIPREAWVKHHTFPTFFTQEQATVRRINENSVQKMRKLESSENRD